MSTITQEYLAQEGITQRPWPSPPLSDDHRIYLEDRVRRALDVDIEVEAAGTVILGGRFTMDDLEQIPAILRSGRPDGREGEL